MQTTFARPSQFAGGSYFKPLEHMLDVALLIEPTSVDREVPNTYKGETKNRDEVTSDITVFKTAEALEKGEPSEVIKGCRVVHGMLTSTLDKAIGQPVPARLEKISTRTGGSGYVFRDLSADIEQKLAAYYQSREAAIDAAMDDVPDFD